MNIITYSDGCVRENSIVKKFEEDIVLNGHKRTLKLEEADAIVYVTCGGTGEIIKDCCDMIYNFLICKREECKLIITGCLASKELFSNIADREDVSIIETSDFLVPLENYLFNLSKQDTLDEKLRSLTNFIYNNPTVIHFSLENGCTNQCSFCKVHYMESDVESLPYEETLNYLKSLIRMGTKKIILGGENLTLYGIDLTKKQMLHTFIHELSKEKGLVSLEINEITIQNMYPELLRELANNPKIESVCLQLESASNRILDLMNRKHTIEQYDYVVKTLKEHGKFITTILMSGFPTETFDDLDYTARYLSDRGIYSSLICEYDDFYIIPSSKLPQYGRREKRHHTIYLCEQIREINRNILLNRVPEIENVIICDNEDGKVKMSNIISGYSFRKEYQDIPIGTVIQDKPRRLVKRDRKNNCNNYLYKY